ncbi:MAG: hypothetical protein ACFCD0_08270 [Gemmataceae bacterium]
MGRLRSFWVCFLVFPLIPSFGQANHVQELLRVVPEDVSLVMTINDLSGNWKRVSELPWTKRLFRSPVAVAFQDQTATKNLKAANLAVQSFLGVDVKELAEKLFGDTVVVAFRHSSQGKQDEERGLLLLWVQDTELLRQAIAVVQKLQKPGTFKELRHNGLKYYLQKDPNQDRYYFQHHNLFAFSGHKDVLCQVIDRYKADATAKPNGIEKQFAKLPHKKAVLTFWVNPRAFDADLDREQQKVKNDNDAYVIAGFRPYWKALDSAAISLTVNERMTLSLHLEGRANELPKPGRRLLYPAPPSQLWQQFPASAVFTATGKVDVEAFLYSLKGFLSPDDRKQFERTLQKDLGAKLVRNVFRDVVPQIGPDVGVCMVTSQESPIPHILAAVKIREVCKGASLGSELYQAARFFAEMAQYHHNREHPNGPLVHVKRESQDGVEVTYLEHKSFPMGASPAFAHKDGYLVFANSPQAIRVFRKVDQATANKPIARLSFQSMLESLQDHKEWVVRLLANSQSKPSREATEWLENVTKMLSLIDKVELRQTTQPNEVTWSLIVYPSKGK